MKRSPIGVFDSGVGGLSVLRAIRRLLPHEELIYVADSAFVPYGNKSPDAIRDRSALLTRFLVGEGAKAIVIACNTATAAAAASLRSIYEMPIVGMEPAVKPAAAATKTGIVGVLATVGTLQSAKFAALLDRFGRGIRVITQPAPGLVEIVEAGRLYDPDSAQLVATFVQPLVDGGADVIVLGCTHYPFLWDLISKAAGPGVHLIETGPAVAAHLAHLLEEEDLLTVPNVEDPPRERFYTTAPSDEATAAFRTLWHPHAEVAALPAQADQ